MPRTEPLVIALDTETTGLDLNHGARPFYVPVCWGDGRPEPISCFRWDVDPVTRQPKIPQGDVSRLRQIIDEADVIVGQNIRFDVRALATVGITDWPWHKTEDTLIGAHLLGSNERHDLTALAARHCRIDIKPLEDALEREVKACRHQVQLAQHRAKKGSEDPWDVEQARWRIAREGLPEMPSAKGSSKKREEKLWAFDMWLPRAMAAALDLDRDDPWWTVLEDYSNADAEATLLVWRVMEAKIRKRGLWNIYRERMKLLPVIVGMEQRGVTLSKRRLNQLQVEFFNKVEDDTQVCLDIAGKFGYPLEMPKGPMNRSLGGFCFRRVREQDPDHFDPDCKGLDLPVVAWTDAGNPSLDKEAIEELVMTLPPDGDQHRFVKALSGIRKRNTSIGYMDSYERFMQPQHVVNNGHFLPLANPDDCWVIHPSVNPTGTDTLRKSSNNPNSQQISKKGLDLNCPHCRGEGCLKCSGEGTIALSIRHAFGPAPGREWWPMDYENLELRIPFYECGQQELIELFEHPDDPPFWGSVHLINCSVVYEAEWNELLRAVGFDKVGPEFKKVYGGNRKEPELYKFGKNGGFSKQYGGGERKVDATFRRRGAYRKLDARFDKLTGLTNSLKAYANRHGYVETIPDRTVDSKRGYPVLCARTEHNDVLPTTPLSYHVQSTAVWCACKAEVRWEEQMKAWRAEGFDCFITLDVHDELVPDFPVVPHCRHGSSAEAMGCKSCGGNGHGKAYHSRPANLWRARVLQRLMERSGDDIGIPLKVALTHCPNNWGEGESY